jgi:hypothetical protein
MQRVSVLAHQELGRCLRWKRAGQVAGRPVASSTRTYMASDRVDSSSRPNSAWEAFEHVDALLRRQLRQRPQQVIPLRHPRAAGTQKGRSRRHRLILPVSEPPLPVRGGVDQYLADGMSPAHPAGRSAASGGRPARGQPQ